MSSFTVLGDFTHLTTPHAPPTLAAHVGKVGTFAVLVAQRRRRACCSPAAQNGRGFATFGNLLFVRFEVLLLVVLRLPRLELFPRHGHASFT